jgi:hypothetical protein
VIGNDPFGGVFGIATPGDNSPDTVVRVAKAAARAGIAIVIIDAGSKAPICPLAARAAKLADQEAQDAGLRRHPCGVVHATSDPKLIESWLRRLTKAGTVYNLAAVPGLSRMIAVDVDTRAELEAWLRDRAAAEGIELDLTATPTVLSPGVVKVDQGGEENWVHKDGGHFWFTLPEDHPGYADAPASKYASETGWVAMFGPLSYALVPPSNRKEGPYRLVGQAEEAPAWLLERIDRELQVTRERRERQANRVRIDDDPIDVWAAATPWADLLAPDGWTDTGKPDSCSPDCIIWTRPGDAAHYKSATAHAEGCGRYSLNGGHGPLHFWTDVRPSFLPADARTVSKLQYAAHRDHSGDMGAAMRALKLGRAGRTVYADVPDEEPVSKAELIRATDADYVDPAGSTASLFDVPATVVEEPEVATHPASQEASVPPPAPPAAGPRPTLGDDAWHGLAADIVRVLDPSTEADPQAVLFVLLAMIGNYFGRRPQAWAGATEHPARLWPLLVGKTAAGKKGTAVNVAAWFLRQFDEEYMRDNVTSGLSTAEGLIQEVADPKPSEAAEDDGFDPGLEPPDKRRIFREDEFATLLGRSRRENNVISAAVREAYDGVPMRVKTRNDPLVATDHHVTIVGCITPEELLAKLTDTDVANGFANRFLVVYSQRSKSLPRDVPFDREAVAGLVSRLDKAVRAAAKVGRIPFTERGIKVWDEYYYAMDARALPGGRIADLVNRWAANTLRLAVTYALLDGEDAMDDTHVRAAIACWQYIEASIRHVFDDEEADKDLQRLMEYVDQAPDVGFRSRNDVYERLFAKHIGKADLDRLLAKLVGTGKYEERKVQPVDEATGKPKGGRPTWVYGRKRRSKPVEG